MNAVALGDMIVFGMLGMKSQPKGIGYSSQDNRVTAPGKGRSLSMPKASQSYTYARDL